MNIIIRLFALLLLATPLAWAQPDAEQEYFSEAELEQLLAPVALYPDTVLSHLLIAATYPLEVVQAERWARKHSHLKGEEAVAAVDNRDWDPSVKALVAFPQLLERMSEDLDWTRRLGEAFLIDEAQVLTSIQNLRQRAYAEGNLKTTEYVEVVREPQTIIIEPRVKEVVYIPYYDTRVVYGTWHWHDHHPVYWHRPSHYYGSSGFYWGSGIHVGSGFYFSSFHWGRHQTVVVNIHHHDRPRFYSARSVAHYRHANHWRHDPQHRRGVAYRAARLSQSYDSPRQESFRQEAGRHSAGRQLSSERQSSGLVRNRVEEALRASPTQRVDRANQPSVQRAAEQAAREPHSGTRLEQRTSPGRTQQPARAAAQRAQEPVQRTRESAARTSSNERQHSQRRRETETLRQHNAGSQSFQRGALERVERTRSSGNASNTSPRREASGGAASRAAQLRARSQDN